MDQRVRPCRDVPDQQPEVYFSPGTPAGNHRGITEICEHLNDQLGTRRPGNRRAGNPSGGARMIPASQAIIIAGLRLESARLFQQATSLEFDAQDLAYQASEMENQAEQEIVGHEIDDSAPGAAGTTQSNRSRGPGRVESM